MSLHVSLVLYQDTWHKVGAQGATDARIAYVDIGESFGSHITLQGDPEVMLAFVDQLRAEMVAAIGAEWPVETAHTEAVPA